MTSSYKRSLYSSIVRIVANVVMIGAVFLGMYMASRSPMSSMSTFCLWFFGISIPVWMGAFALIARSVRSTPMKAPPTSNAPAGRSLVYWRSWNSPSTTWGSFADIRLRKSPLPSVPAALGRGPKRRRRACRKAALPLDCPYERFLQFLLAGTASPSKNASAAQVCWPLLCWGWLSSFLWTVCRPSCVPGPTIWTSLPGRGPCFPAPSASTSRATATCWSP